jgi:hypothetical protein
LVIVCWRLSLRCIGTFHRADIKRPRDLITTLHDHQAGCVVAVVVRLLSLTDRYASFVAKAKLRGKSWVEVALARVRYLRPRLAFRLTLRMHRLVAALFALIDFARRCGQVCTGYGVVARTATRRACSQSGLGAWSPVGELVSFGLAGITESSTPVPSVALPVQWRGI